MNLDFFYKYFVMRQTTIHTSCMVHTICRIGSTLSLLMLLLIIPTHNAISQNWNDPHNYYQAQNSTSENRLLQNVEAYHLQPGMDRMSEGRFQRAQAEFDFILRYFPNHPRALLLMGDLSIKMNKPGIAHEYFNKAIELYPQHAATYLVYGVFLQRSENPKAAITQYKRAIEKNPDSSEAHYNLGLAYLEIGDLDNSKKHAVKAYELGYPLPGLKDKLSEAGAW